MFLQETIKRSARERVRERERERDRVGIFIREPVDSLVRVIMEWDVGYLVGGLFLPCCALSGTLDELILEGLGFRFAKFCYIWDVY